jgi:hypothetical protein
VRIPADRCHIVLAGQQPAQEAAGVEDYDVHLRLLGDHRVTSFRLAKFGWGRRPVLDGGGGGLSVLGAVVEVHSGSPQFGQVSGRLPWRLP